MPRALNSNNTNTDANSIKFLYSYDGKILPRRTDGNLRYVGGYTRVLAVDRSITFAELMMKFGELCGRSMSLRCKLPSEDLDLLISVTCDEDLAAVIEEYDRVSSSMHQDTKIRAILFPLKSINKISPPTSAVPSVNFSASKSPPNAAAEFYFLHPRTAAFGYGGRCYSPAVGFPDGIQKGAGRILY